MKSIKFLICFFFLSTSIHANCPSLVTNYFSYRSQGVNAARRLAGMTNNIHQGIYDTVWGTISATFEYTRSFKSDHIARCLFGDDLIFNECCQPSIRTSGSCVPDRCCTDWLADYFFLPTDFVEVISFKPVIDNFLVDFGFYIGLDQWAKGLYFQVQAPLAHTRWDLNMQHVCKDGGLKPFEAGYFTPLESIKCRASIIDFLTGFSFGPIVQDVDGDPNTTADLVSVFIQPLKFAQMSCQQKVRTRLADLRAFFGWNYYNENNYHLGVNFQVAAPTGNRPEGYYLFEPIVGNGHHWEIGLGITGHWRPYENEQTESHLGIWFDANITHLIKATQLRTFDLCNRPLSRYMLALKMDTTIDGNLRGDDNGTLVAPSHQFDNEYLPVANITSFNVRTNANIQTDIVLMMDYTSGGFSWDLGYEFWFRSCENVKPACANPLGTCNSYALKGDSYVFGFETNNPNNTPVKLSPSQKCADIHAGLNFPRLGVTDSTQLATGRRNPNIDNPLPASGDANNDGFENLTATPGGNANTDKTNTSVNPDLITICDVDLCAGRSRGLSSKVFTHFQYQWLHHEEWFPYLGVGAEIEFAHNGSQCTDDCSPCISCAASQWGIWLKFGASYN